MPTVKVLRRNSIRKRIRKVVKGTTGTPRLSVFRSNKDIYAQLIDDSTGQTIVAASSRKINDKINKTEKAVKVGVEIASKAKAAGIEKVVFDRGGYLYHGRVKSLAEGARTGGLNF
ncbi:MAG: 50S ribosomal protein L18 [Bacteroidetes bacterium]|nr:50S ribosomal protein L18 [Bacteroidota bacterium]MBL0051091.1 50S ribosomal protein L18 [Bacteroidota bacterium]